MLTSLSSIYYINIQYSLELLCGLKEKSHLSTRYLHLQRKSTSKLLTVPKDFSGKPSGGFKKIYTLQRKSSSTGGSLSSLLHFQHFIERYYYHTPVVLSASSNQWNLMMLLNLKTRFSIMPSNNNQCLSFLSIFSIYFRGFFKLPGEHNLQ